MSLLTALASADELHDIKPPLDLPPDYFFWLILLGILLAVGGGFLIRFFIRKSKQSKKILAPPKSSWDTALERLRALQEKNLAAQGRIEEYYVQLSDIIRRYMEDRFQIKAPEMTTEEFLWSLNDASGLNDSQKKLLKDFLNSCDMVKFAKYGPMLSEMEESFRFAVKLVEETTPEKKRET